VKFKNLPFELYLKSLEEIKKRLRNDNGEDEEKLNNDLEMQDLGNNSKEEASKPNRNTLNNEESVNNRKRKDKSKRRGKDNKGTNDDEKDRGKGKKGANDKDDASGDKRKVRGKAKSKKVVKNHQEEKIEIMGGYFLKWNIFFSVKVIVILLLSASYYLVISINDQSTMASMLSFDLTTNSIQGVYKQSFMIYLDLKRELATYIDWELAKKTAAFNFDSNSNATVFFNNYLYTNKNQLLKGSYYKMNLPSQINTPKIGTLLMPLINTDLATASTTINNLNKLYNLDACSIIFSKEVEVTDYAQCAEFWSSILLKGMEQSITQMSVVITSVLDDLHSLNQNSKTLEQVLAAGSTFNTYEQFVELYLFKSYMRTVQIFRELNYTNLDIVYAVYRTIMIGYICFIVILSGLLVYFVHKSKYIFNTLMNFIGILPVKFLLEDPSLYKEILRLERYIY